MQRSGTFLLTPLLIIACAAAQTLVTRDAAHKPDYLVRMIRMETHLAAGVTGEKSCLLISPDGRFRMESGEPNYDTRTKPKVYLSSLTPEQLENLRSLLENDELKDLHSSEPRQQIIGRDLDMFVVEIVRGDHIQDLNAFKDDTHSKVDQPLQNLENWMVRMGKQKWPQDKSAVANVCKAL